MKRYSIVILVALSLVFNALPVANAAVTPGTKCSKVGIKQTYKGKVYTCIKLGKNLYWNNGTRNVSPTPNASVTPTPQGVELKRPKFLASDLTCLQSQRKLKVSWQGLDVDGKVYGKEFGYVDVLYKHSTDSEWKSAGVFIKSNFLLVPVIPKLIYNIKLVAYTKTGVPSSNSDIQTKTLCLGPNKPTNLNGFWSGTKFVVTFTQNPLALGNENIKNHKITLTSSTNISFDFEFPVVPGDTQIFELGEIQSNTYFGPQINPRFSVSVWSIDVFDSEGEKAALKFIEITPTPRASSIKEPRFIDNDLDAINSIIYVRWSGLNSTFEEYDSKELKQINIWIAGGDFGDEFTKFVRSFEKSGKIEINVSQRVTYCVKLQAESFLGILSDFSDTYCLTVLRQPKAPGAP